MDRITEVAAESECTSVMANDHYVGNPVPSVKILHDMLGVGRHEPLEGVRELEVFGEPDGRGAPRATPAPLEADG